MHVFHCFAAACENVFWLEVLWNVENLQTGRENGCFPGFPRVWRCQACIRNILINDAWWMRIWKVQTLWIWNVEICVLDASWMVLPWDHGVFSTCTHLQSYTFTFFLTCSSCSFLLRIGWVHASASLLSAWTICSRIENTWENNNRSNKIKIWHNRADGSAK